MKTKDYLQASEQFGNAIKQVTNGIITRMNFTLSQYEFSENELSVPLPMLAKYWNDVIQNNDKTILPYDGYSNSIKYYNSIFSGHMIETFGNYIHSEKCSSSIFFNDPHNCDMLFLGEKGNTFGANIINRNNREFITLVGRDDYDEEHESSTIFYVPVKLIDYHIEGNTLEFAKELNEYCLIILEEMILTPLAECKRRYDEAQKINAQKLLAEKRDNDMELLKKLVKEYPEEIKQLLE